MTLHAPSRTCLASMLLGGVLLLTGCDVLAFSSTLPGLLPGLGAPITGTVLDARTGLPLGHATVLGNAVSVATTDSQGHFTLYRDIGNAISFERAGYTAATYALGPPASNQAYYLDPQFPDDGALVSQYVNLQGDLTVNGNVPASNGNVTFEGADSYQLSPAGGYAISVHENASGMVDSGVLFGGLLQGGPVVPASGQSPAPFDYQLFGYRFVNVPTSGNPNVAPITMATLDASSATSATPMTISYQNLAPGATLETDISLDFGLLSSVPIARTFGSSVDIPLPAVGIASPKYLVDGVASSTSGNQKQVSEISYTTTTLGGNDFTLLSYPQPRSPGNGQTGVGRWPTFSWTGVPGASAYYVELYEGANLKPKWRGYTTGTSIGYPQFWDGDSNGGALLPASQASYSWTVHAVDEDAALLVPSSRPLVPDRHRVREAYTSGMEFSR